MDEDALSALTPEAALIVLCCATRRAAPGVERLHRLLDRSLDWTTVLTLAQRHGALGCLHDRLRLVSPDRLPSRLPDRLAARAARLADRRERRRGALGPVLDALLDARVDVIPLTETDETSAATRSVPELLVRRRDLSTAMEVLTKLDLQPDIPLTSSQLHAYLRAFSWRRFVDTGDRVVSLQWDVDDRSVLHGVPVEALWRRSVAGHAVDRPCLRLRPADLLLLRCVRGTSRRWHCLQWVREIAALLEDGAVDELARVLSDATAHGARRAVALGVGLAVDLLGASAPTELANASRDPRVRALRGEVLEDLVAVPRPLPTRSRIARFHLRSRERLGDRIRYLVRRAAGPGATLVFGVRPLPRALSFLELVVHPTLRAAHAAAQFARIRWGRGSKLARFARTPVHVIDRMLTLARVTPSDTLLDIGCGDGTIVIRAAQRIGCRGLGVDVQGPLVDAARAHARAAGVSGLVTFVHGDVRSVDLGEPTVVSLYLNRSANLTLRPTLERRLREGARVVSFNFDMDDWWPDDVDVVDETSWGSDTIYLWEVTRPVPVAPS